MRSTTRLLIAGYVILALAGFVHGAKGADAKNVSSDDVAVRKLDLDLPAEHGTPRMYDVLWDTFVNTPDEEKFSRVTSLEWKATFRQYRECLVAKAKVQTLDWHSLDSCLNKIFKDAEGENQKTRFASMPVGAYLARQGGNAVWIVVVKWEEEYRASPSFPQSFGHVMVYAYDAKSFKRIGFCSCD